MPIQGKKVIRILEEKGWVRVSQRGSHVKLKKGDKMTIVPVHTKDLAKPLIKAIEKQTGEKII